jgi:hypothetical protein
MALIATIYLNGTTGQVSNYFGNPGSISLPAGTHTTGSGIYNVSFATEKYLKLLPTGFAVTITDTTARALISKLSAPVTITAFPTPVKFLYTVSFTIAVTQIQCLLLGLCTTVPADPDTLITVRISMDEFEICECKCKADSHSH